MDTLDFAFITEVASNESFQIKTKEVDNLDEQSLNDEGNSKNKPDLSILTNNLTTQAKKQDNQEEAVGPWMGDDTNPRFIQTGQKSLEDNEASSPNKK